jgi:cytochrome b subunit of formate dehydrogenase/mono/diheme cytochrome c family protein
MDKPTNDAIEIKMGSSPKQNFVRFELSQRIEHLVMLISFTILALTGLPQKFPESPISVGFVGALGGIEQTRLIHHISAVVLMVVSIYHIVAVLYRVLVLRVPLTMLPLIQDFVHLYHDLLYYVGLRRHKAYYGRYSYAEKVEYLAVVWGTLIMAITGFMMWNPIATANWLPGEAIPAAKAAHGAEAILAVLAVILWHFYHVHLRHLNKSMFTGKLSRTEMQHEHPAELMQIESEQAWRPPSAEVIRRRQIYFLPVALVAVAGMGFGLIRFITLEDTAITTVPRGETAQVFVPVTPTPRPTPAPTATPELAEGVSPNSWAGTYEALFRNRCGTCHGITAVGGLSLATYENALKGGKSGPAIVPGDPEASILVQVQGAGDHPGQLTDEELQAVIEWIEAGAPEE